MYLIHFTLATMYGLAPDGLSLPTDNPVIQHLLDRKNRQTLFTSSEIENVLNGLATFDWYNYRQVLSLLQHFLHDKIFHTLFQNSGNLYQVCQSPSHYVKILSYESSTSVEDTLQAILKAQSYISGRFKQMNHSIFSISYKNEEKFQTATSELSSKYIFVITPMAQSSHHSTIIRNFRALHTPSTSGFGTN